MELIDSEYVDTISLKYAKAVDADLEFASVDALTLVPALPDDDTPLGLLGDPALVTDNEEFPRAAALAKTREGFHGDLAKMAEVAGRWTMKGDRVHINVDLQFSVGGESIRFFSTLFWLRPALVTAARPGIRIARNVPRPAAGRVH